MSLISFIIPAYNAGNVLKRAVESILLAAVHSDYELIIVENGSSDDTSEVISDLVKLHPTIREAHSDPGVSNARNRGLEMASGKWIAFLDADDALSETASRMIFDAENSDADLICYGHIRSGKKHSVTKIRDGERFTGRAEIEKMRIRMLKAPTTYMQVWAKLFRRSVIEAYNLRFHPDLRLSEDSDFMFRFTRCCKKAEFSADCVYLYSVNPDSVMRTGDGSRIKEYAKAMDEIVRDAERNRESLEIRKALTGYILNHFNIAMVRSVFCAANPAPYRKKRKQMLSACKIPIFRSAILQVSLSEASKNFRLLPGALLKLRLPDAAAALFGIRAAQNKKEEM